MSKIKPKLSKVPKVTACVPKEGENGSPVEHYSYSSLALFSTNPLLFKIKYINRQRIDSTHNISGVVGRAFHTAMEQYWAPEGDVPSSDEDALRQGLEAGMTYLTEFPEGWIEWSSTVPNRQKAMDILAFAYAEYTKAKPRNNGEQVLACEEMIREDIDIEWRGNKLTLPVPLKGYIDKVIRTKDGNLKIVDYKTARSFSDPEKIDGKKILQAVHYYLLSYAKYKEEPYSVIFEEVKTSKNRDGSPQVKEYEVVFADNDLFFDFYFRLYEDVTRALNGQAVYVPNIDTFFDNEVGIVAYINRLDMSDEQAALMKKYKVDNLTDLLKKQIQQAGNMRKLLKSVEEKFVASAGINYENMQPHEKISTKLLEHGMAVKHYSTVDGAAVELHQFNPSIGLKMSRLKGYAADIEQALGKKNVRILAPIPGTSMVGFEVPKDKRYFPALPDPSGTWELNIGMDIMGKVKKFDLRDAPHMLVAGATGAGKSVFLNSLIEQILRIPKVELHLFDPKQVELAHYEEDAVQYLTSHSAINAALEDLIIEMEDRYTRMKQAKVRNIEGMPDLTYKVVVIDEFGDLVINANVETNMLILAQKARAAGIHMIVATQRPSVDIIKGTIRANFPIKAAFKTNKEVDSKVILDITGAEKLLGKGDMLFASHEGIERLQGFNV